MFADHVHQSRLIAAIIAVTVAMQSSVVHPTTVSLVDHYTPIAPDPLPERLNHCAEFQVAELLVDVVIIPHCTSANKYLLLSVQHDLHAAQQMIGLYVLAVSG